MSIYKLVLTGDNIGDVNLTDVIAYAKARGFTVTAVTTPDGQGVLPEPSWTDEELQRIDPLSELTHMYKSADDRTWLKAVRVITSYDLTQITFEAFLEAGRGVTQEPMRLKGQVLEFMIRHRIRFSNLDPATAFPDTVKEAGFTGRTKNALLREGIERLGVLTYFTAREVEDSIRNFGPKSIEEVRFELSRRGLALKGE